LAVDLVDGARKDVTAECANRNPETYAYEALREGARLILRTCPPAFAPELAPFGEKRRASASMMFAPVRKERQAIAVLSIESYEVQAYNDSDLRLFQAVADHCASALERIRAEDEVQRLNRELRRRVEELETIFNVAPVGLAVARDPQSQVVTSNPACAAMLGLPQGDGASPEAAPKLLREGVELPMTEWPMQKAAAQGITVAGEELDVIRADGKTVNCYIAASPLYDEASEVRGSLGVFLDLTERKQAEQEILRLNSDLERRVRERTAQLEAINKELEAFSYSVSHDLRAPLRSIRGFSEVLLERYAGKLDTRGQEFLRRACESSQQMDRLIEDLLKLSRVSRSELQRRIVDLSTLAESIVSDLQQANPERIVKVDIAADLKAPGDARLLRIVLENLLRNAWKFTSRQPEGRIEFGWTGEHAAFFIRDNGAGFDMTYATKLFGVFQRLHSVTEFPGTGVGLATVQRIINRHGGRVWAQAAVGQGATFYFTLPEEDLS
jgi:PAS domain S-box-containing protein